MVSYDNASLPPPPQTASQSVHPFFHGSRLTVMTNTQTDHATPSVAMGRIYAMYAMPSKIDLRVNETLDNLYQNDSLNVK